MSNPGPASTVTLNTSGVWGPVQAYVEGSFTPSLTFGGNAVGMTYGIRTGSYTKIGNRVFFELEIVLTATGSSTGNASIGGLPFTVETDTTAAVHATAVTSGVGDTYLAAFLAADGTSIVPSKIATGTATQLTHSDFTNTSALTIAGHYQVAAQ